MDYLNIIFEAAVVKRIKRTGWQILGDNEESVGEHCFMTSVISYLLARKVRENNPDQEINTEKILLMAIFHDFHEARTGEVDKVAMKYVNRDEGKANSDIFGKTDPSLLEVLEEYEDKKSLESRIVYEANILALLVELKGLMERGNINAREWMTGNKTRLKLTESIEIAENIGSGNTQDWWTSIRREILADFRK